MSQLGQYTTSGSGGVARWYEVAGNVVSLLPNSGYILNNAGLTTATLPFWCSAGQVIRIVGNGGLFIVDQNAGQSIKFGNISTTNGVLGSIASTQQYDVLEILCTVSDTTFVVLNSVGNFVLS